MSDQDEAEITINGRRVTSGQSMTIRVALEAFAMDLQANGLGNDAHGKAMAALYLAQVRELRTHLFTHHSKENP